jgi:peptidoglycan/LPS O-acetylase OafA/YrhL
MGDATRATSAAGTERRTPLDALTGLRFFAALHVVLYHFAIPALPAAMPAGLRHAVGHGYVGVSFFYLLSGFILAYNYVVRDEAGVVAMRGTRSAFWWNRFARVYPLYVAAWLLAAPTVVAHRLEADGASVVALGKLVVAAVTSLGLMQAWLPGAHAWWNPPSWSISVEAFFYAVFPVVLPWLGSPRRPRLGLPFGLLLAALGIPVLFLLAGNPDSALAFVKYDPLLHLPTFALGVLLAELLDSPHRATLLRLRGALAACGAVALALALRTPSGPHDILFHNGLLVPAFAALILAVALGLPIVTPVLASRPLVLLGEASFGVYILQAPVRAQWERLRLGLAPSLDVPLFVMALMAVALVAYRAIEVPAQRWLRARSPFASKN